MDGPGSVIADDLTGAMDCGGELARRGGKVRVALDAASMRSLSQGAAAVVLDAESRSMSPASAFRATRNALRALARAGLAIGYKKIDSGLRGNVGAELEAVLTELPGSVVVLAPALPAAGRITVHGVHCVDGVPLSESELGQDIFCGVSSSRIPEVVRSTSKLPVGEIDISTVAAGAGSVARKLEMLSAEGKRIVACDAESFGHLVSIAGAMASLGSRCIGCGSAGLFAATIEVSRRVERPPGALDPLPRSVKPPVVFSASLSRVSRGQIGWASRDGQGCAAMYLDVDAVFSSRAGASREVARVAESCRSAIAAGMPVIVDGASRTREEILASGLDRRGLSAHRRSILEALAGISRILLRDGLFDALGLVGGDAARWILRGCSGIDIRGEVEPCVPSGVIVGGPMDGFRVVTKAGGFGSPESVSRIIEYLRSIPSARARRGHRRT